MANDMREPAKVTHCDLAPSAGEQKTDKLVLMTIGTIILLEHTGVI